ncbi:UNVERIFIED_CONTAM: hypothetical protein FKN15_025738 [Acipenser sinensis]
MNHLVNIFSVPYVRSNNSGVDQAMWLMLQQDEPEDFVIATREVHSVQEFVEKAFKHVGKNIVWEGKNKNEVGHCNETGVIDVRVDLKYYRPTEVVNQRLPVKLMMN